MQIYLIDFTGHPRFISLATMNSTHLFHEDIANKSSVRIVFLVLYLLITAIGGLGNGTVIYLLFPGHRSSTDSSTLLLICLAVCDLFMCIAMLPMEIANILVGFVENKDMLSPDFCKTCAFVGVFISCVKFHILTLISLERYMIICHPFKALHWLRFKRVIKALCVILLLAFAISLPIPIEFTNTGKIRLKGTKLVFCSWLISHGGRRKEWLIYYSLLFFLYYILPVIVMIIAYSAVFAALYKMDGIMMNQLSLKNYTKKRRRLAKRMLSLAMLFTLLHSPFFILKMSISLGMSPPQKNGIFMMMCFSYFMGLNSAIDPYVYCSQVKVFVKKKIISLCHKQADHGDAVLCGDNVNVCTRM